MFKHVQLNEYSHRKSHSQSMWLLNRKETLRPVFEHKSTKIWTKISNYMSGFIWDIIIHSFMTNSTLVLTKPPLKFGNGLVIIYHKFMRTWLFTHVLNSVLYWIIFVSKRCPRSECPSSISMHYHNPHLGKCNRVFIGGSLLWVKLSETSDIRSWYNSSVVQW